MVENIPGEMGNILGRAFQGSLKVSKPCLEDTVMVYNLVCKRYFHGLKILPWFEDTFMIPKDRNMVWRYCHGLQKILSWFEDTAMVWRYCHGLQKIQSWFSTWFPKDADMVWRYSHGLKIQSWFEDTVMVWRYCHGFQKILTWFEVTVMVWRYRHGLLEGLLNDEEVARRGSWKCRPL